MSIPLIVKQGILIFSGSGRVFLFIEDSKVDWERSQSHHMENCAKLLILHYDGEVGALKSLLFPEPKLVQPTGMSDEHRAIK